MQRQSFSAFHKSLLETQKDSARLREVHSRAGVHSFRDVSFRDVYFISETCLFAKAKDQAFCLSLYPCSLVSIGLDMLSALRDVLPN